MAVVLIVDDEADVRFLCGVVLAAAGHEMVEAADGVEALAVIASREVDVVVSDFMMPRMDGVELREVLAESHPSLPVMLWSAAAAPHVGGDAVADVEIKEPLELDVSDLLASGDPSLRK